MHSADRIPSGIIINELRALEESLWRAETRFNSSLMERILAPDFFEYGRSGRIYARSELLSESGASETIDAVLPLPDFHVRLLSEDVAQVTYVSEQSFEGSVLKANRSSIWSRIEGRWRLRFHQGTPVP